VTGFQVERSLRDYGAGHYAATLAVVGSVGTVLMVIASIAWLKQRWRESSDDTEKRHLLTAASLEKSSQQSSRGYGSNSSVLPVSAMPDDTASQAAGL
jgi:hypothetical protein